MRTVTGQSSHIENLARLCVFGLSVALLSCPFYSAVRLLGLEIFAPPDPIHPARSHDWRCMKSSIVACVFAESWIRRSAAQVMVLASQRSAAISRQTQQARTSATHKPA
jgi:hypothetical protein